MFVWEYFTIESIVTKTRAFVCQRFLPYLTGQCIFWLPGCDRSVLNTEILKMFGLHNGSISWLNWAAPSEFVSSSIPSWQTLTAHAQPFRGARDLAFCLKVPLDSLLVWASSEGSGETARMRRLAWTFAARIGDKYQIRLARPNYVLSYCRNSWCLVSMQQMMMTAV